MVIDDQLTTVTMRYPKTKSTTVHESDINTWLTLLEQELANQFEDITMQVDHDLYRQVALVTIKFKNIEDATAFKLRQSQ